MHSLLDPHMPCMTQYIFFPQIEEYINFSVGKYMMYDITYCELEGCECIVFPLYIATEMFCFSVIKQSHTHNSNGNVYLLEWLVQFVELFFLQLILVF